MGKNTGYHCDRCGKDLGHSSRSMITMNYHHPKKVDLCEICEGDFTIWLGKHPGSGIKLSEIAKGNASGAGYPSAQRAANYLLLGRYDG